MKFKELLEQDACKALLYIDYWYDFTEEVNLDTDDLGEGFSEVDELENLECYQRLYSPEKLSDNFTLSCVESKGGREGEGEEVVRTFKIEGEGIVKYVSVMGFYDSYNGTDWDKNASDLIEVFPVERMVVFYEPK